jgi:AraC family transcriptional regulator
MDSIRPVRFEVGRPMLSAGIRRWHTHAGAPTSIRAQWADFRNSSALRDKPEGSFAYGILCAAKPGEFEYMTAVEVQAFDGLEPGTGRMRLPPLNFAVFEHSGPVAEIHLTWKAIWEEWLPSSGMKPVHAPEFERYDHRFNPLTRDGVVEIWSPVATPPHWTRSTRPQV